MDKLTKFIVKHKIWFIAFFLVALIVSACLISQVKINYNLTGYIPDDAEFGKADEISGEEFGKNEVITAMLKNVEQNEQVAVVTALSAISGVQNVTVTNYNASEKALLTTITFKETLTNKQLKETIKSIRNNELNKPAYLSGMAINDTYIQDTANGESMKILIFLIPIILLVLIFTSRSWLDPLICLGVMGVAIVISMGTNVMFVGGVSFITQSILAALTMAISMDYSIFLLHAFRDEREKGVEVKEAVANALKKSFTTITVGSLTTIAGFVAMLFMKFALGMDMGLVFGKTIIISLLTVLLLMPGILVLLHKPIEKTMHRNLFPSFRPIGKFAVKARYVMAVFALLLLAPAIYGQFNNNFIYGFSAMTEAKSSDLYKDKQEITKIFDIGNQLIVFHNNDGDIDKEFTVVNDFFAYRDGEKKIVKATSQSYSIILNSLYTNVSPLLTAIGMPAMTLTAFDASITNPQSPLMTTLNGMAQNPATAEVAGQALGGIQMVLAGKPMFVGANYSRVILELDMPEEGAQSFSNLEKLKAIANTSYKDNNYFYGLSQVAYDIKKVVEVDYVMVTVISIAAIFLLIMIPFRSLIIPLILLLVIMLGIFVNMAIPFFAGITLSYISYLIISAIQLGCTIDYAILMISKYKSYRVELDAKNAAIESVNNSASSIITSGGILTIVGVLINIISSNQLISETGGMLWRAGLLSMFFVFFLLPGLFVIFDKLIIRHKKDKLLKGKDSAKPDLDSSENSTSTDNISSENSVNNTAEYTLEDSVIGSEINESKSSEIIADKGASVT